MTSKMKSWICPNDEAENPIEFEYCEVCGLCMPEELRPPKIVLFETDKSIVLNNGTVMVSWSTEYAKIVSLNGITVPAKGSERLPAVKEYILSVQNENDTVERTVKIEVAVAPSISFITSKTKFHKGWNESAYLEWKVDNALKISLLQDGRDTNVRCQSNGSYQFRIDEDTAFTLQVLALDGKTIEQKQIAVSVFHDAVVSFEADKEYVFPSVPFTLNWSVENAKKVELNGMPVPFQGKKLNKSGVSRDTTFVLRVTDEFGIKERSLTIRLLPIPLVKSINVPVPIFENNIDVQISLQMPQISTELPFVQLNDVEILPHTAYDLEAKANLAKTPLEVEPLFDLGTPTIIQKLMAKFQGIINKRYNEQ